MLLATCRSIIDFYPNVTVVYLPTNIKFLLQQMAQGINATFKRYYMKRWMRQAIAVTELDKSITLRDFWKMCDIYIAEQNITTVLNGVQSTDVNGICGVISSKFVNDLKGLIMLLLTKRL